MDKKAYFFDIIKHNMSVTLATAVEGSVTMRVVSPVYYQDSILIFTHAGSRKYKQLKANTCCCISAGIFIYAEATAKFYGGTMLPENKKLRDAYSAKFPDAFKEGVEFNGRDAEFILLSPTKLTGWAFENDIPTEDGAPSIPFEISL